MDFEMTAKSMTLFAEKVVPQLRDLGTVRKGFGPLPASRKKRIA
jgi:hypothetical protein